MVQLVKAFTAMKKVFFKVVHVASKRNVKQAYGRRKIVDTTRTHPVLSKIPHIFVIFVLRQGTL